MMLIATDGACKRNGKPTCTSVGVAWIQEENGNMCFRSRFETESTSQRGEINGLIEALKYAVLNASADEDIVIISDSEYLCNTVGLEWCMKWRANNWIGASGETVKNHIMWNQVCTYLDELNRDHERVYIQWVKGHLVSYTPGNVAKAMAEDDTGLVLYDRILSVANRPSEYDRIVNELCSKRKEHAKLEVPREIAHEWVVANVMADALAGYIVKIFDAVYLQKLQDSIN